MTSAHFKKTAVAASLLIAMGYVSLALAHDWPDSLGVDAGATDFFQVLCSNDGVGGAPVSLVISVHNDTAAATAHLSVQTQVGNVATNSTDPINGDLPYSPTVTINGGAGPYNVLVDKDGAGALTYTLSYHCMGTAGHTGTDITGLQDQ